MPRRLFVGLCFSVLLVLSACGTDSQEVGSATQSEQDGCKPIETKTALKMKCPGIKQLEWRALPGMHFVITPGMWGSYTLSQINYGKQMNDIDLTPAVNSSAYSVASSFFDPSARILDDKRALPAGCVGDDFWPTVTFTDKCGNQTTIRPEVIVSGEDVNLFLLSDFVESRANATDIP